MTERNNNKILLLFLATFKHQLIAMAETMKTKVLRRSDLENIFAFKIAGNQEKEVIHEMVSDVAFNKGPELQTGHDGLDDANLVSGGAEENGMGKAKTYSSSHFHSDKEAA